MLFSSNNCVENLYICVKKSFLFIKSNKLKRIQRHALFHLFNINVIFKDPLQFFFLHSCGIFLAKEDLYKENSA